MAKQANNWKRYWTKRKLIVLTVLIVAVLTTLVTYFIVVGQNDKQAKENDENTPRPMKVLTGDEIAGQIERSTEDKEKASLYLDLASTKQGEGKLQEALDAAMKSIEINPTHEAYAMAGAIYVMSENNEKALEMYQKALGLTEKVENPNEVSPYNNYRMEILNLGGQV